MHDIDDAAGVHETHGDVELVSICPGAAHTEDVGMLGEGHELCLTLEEAQGRRRKAVEVEDLEGDGNGIGCILWLVLGSIDGG